MKILHVILGDPYRYHGGMFRYCKDLSSEQKKHGDEVFFLIPGRFTISRKVAIKKKAHGFFVLLNPLPVSLIFGICDPASFMRPGDLSFFRTWLIFQKFDVIHIHSIEGIYLEFFQAAHDLGIPMIFTTHDYFPACPKTTLFNFRNKICFVHNDNLCCLCNHGCGLNGINRVLVQDPLVQKLKRFSLFSGLKKMVRKKASSCATVENFVPEPKDVYLYQLLFLYYKKIIGFFSVIHCNSYQSYRIFSSFYPGKRYAIIPISHYGLLRQERFFGEMGPVFHFGYLGGLSNAKGYGFLRNSLGNAPQLGCPYDVICFGDDFLDEKADPPFIFRHAFTPKNEKEAWASIDALLVPSQWLETFGFVVLEALARGIPVICSSIVGAKYLISSVDPKLVFKFDSKRGLLESMVFLMNPQNYLKIVKKIPFLNLPLSMQQHYSNISILYSQVLER